MKAKNSRDINDFLNTHNEEKIVCSKILAGLKDLGESWEYEGEFIKRCKVSNTQFGKYKHNYEQYSFTAPMVGQKAKRKRIWAGTLNFVAKLKNISGEQS